MGKAKAMTRKRIVPLVLLCAGVVAAILAGMVLFCRYYDGRVANFKRATQLFVYPGTGVEELAKYVADNCSPRSKASVRRAFSKIDGVRPGHYSIDTGCSSSYVARMLSHGWQTPVRLTISGALRRDAEIAGKISAQMMVDSLSMIEALRDPVLLDSLGFTPRNVFALFIPDTYEVWWTDSPEEILRRQKREYDAFWTLSNLEKAEKLGLSRMEVSILASIVKGETNCEAEMPTIAGVYLNRLKKGMKLQADPTVAYCFDYKPGRILKAHLSVDSPYNTYRYKGLPPGPICVPTKASLNAVLNPDRHDYMFFCASPDFDGTHLFARSYDGHRKNARAFQKALSEASARKNSNNQ